jgi:hypothetical protein
MAGHIQLTPKDRVILTNASALSIYGRIPQLKSVTGFQLPLSSYGKTIYLVLSKKGRKTLVLADFDSKAYLIHIGLLINRYRQNQNLQFSIYENISPLELKESYGQLLKFANANPFQFSSLDALVVGYSSTFERLWQKYHKKTSVQEAHLYHRHPMQWFSLLQLDQTTDFYCTDLGQRMYGDLAADSL